MGNFITSYDYTSVDFLLCFVLGVTILGLEFALELFAISIDLRQLVIGEFAPLLLNLA